MRYRGLLIGLLLPALGACSFFGAQDSVVTEQIPAGMAQLTINRSGGILYLSVPAIVEVNGQRFAELGRDDAYTAFIRPGQTVVSASGVSPPGRYTISFNAAAGKTYRFEVSPRREGYVEPPGRRAIDYVTNENDGAFKILPAS